MKRFARRSAVIISLGLLVAVIGAGCTLTGATEPPPITIAPTVVTPQAVLVTPTKAPVIGTPTPVKTLDTFGTLTAIAPKPGTPGTPAAPPVGIVTPTKAGIVTPTPIGNKTAVPGSAASGTGACPPTYTVQSGDNLFRIALKYNLTVSAIASANKITNPDLLSVGTVLSLPCGGAASTTGGTGSTTTTTTSGGTTVKPLAGDTVDKNGDILHTVKSGENLFRIALAYGLSWQLVATYNGISQPNEIVVGQVIRIPTK